MTGKEILEYGKKIIDLKKNIEDSYSSEPDLRETINTKFSEDTVNRAKFIDSTLIIGGVATEFRNVFGVEAPHYEISKCHIGINTSGLVDGQYKLNDRLSISDPMQENTSLKPEEEVSNSDNPADNPNFRSFLDCWEMINAARFDSQEKTKNFTDDSLNLPVNKQRFFVDANKDNSGSSIYRPFCPPGYDKWAGKKVYDKICKNFELDELALFKILYNGDRCTVNGDYSIDFSGKLDSEGNMVENLVVNTLSSDYGRLVNGDFTYSFDASNSSFLLEAQEAGKYGMPREGCTPHDGNPVHYLKCNVPVTSIKIGDKYYYSFNRAGTIFEKTRTPLVKFKLNDLENVTSYNIITRTTQTITTNEFNNGYAMLCEDPFQDLPEYGYSAISSFPMRFSMNVIYSQNNNWDRGKEYSWQDTVTHTTTKGWLFKRVTNVSVETVTYTNTYPYRLTISPIKISTNLDLRTWLVKYVKSLEDDCINYYNFTDERGIKNNIPDIDRSVRKMVAVRDAADAWLNNKTEANFNNFIDVLADRVLYDVFMDNYSSSQKSLFSLNTTINTNSANALKTGDFTYVDYYITTTTGRWFWKKVTRTPVYATGTSFRFEFGKTTRNIENRVKRSFIESVKVAQPSASTSTSSGWFSSNTTATLSKETTLYYLLNNLLTPEQVQSLINSGYLSSDRKVLTVNGVRYNVNNSNVYSFEIISGNSECLPFDNIKRASVLNHYLTINPELYAKIFYIAMSRINKRNGTLREVCNLAESTTAIAQMTNSKVENVSDLFDYLNAYSISGGYGNNIITIKLATWESDEMAYATLGRLSTVYLLCDGTATDSDTGEFVGPYWIKTKITEVIDKVSDPIVEYVLIDESENVRKDKEYYIRTSPTTFRLLNSDEVNKYTKQELYRRSVTSGPIFRVTLQDVLPEDFMNKSPMLVKVC